jgi:hypothetical protein
VSLKLEGYKELRTQLQGLGAIGGRKVLASAARRAFRPVLLEVQRLAPVQTGALKHSYKLAVVQPKSGAVVVSVGVVAGSRGIERIEQDVGGGDIEIDVREHAGAQFRWHLSEFGVPSRGIRARPHLRPAFGSKGQEAASQLGIELRKAIDRAVRRKNKAALAGGGGDYLGAAFGGGAL